VGQIVVREGEKEKKRRKKIHLSKNPLSPHSTNIGEEKERGRQVTHQVHHRNAKRRYGM